MFFSLQNTEDDTYYYEYPYYEDMEVDKTEETLPTAEVTETETSETEDVAGGRVTFMI